MSTPRRVKIEIEYTDNHVQYHEFNGDGLRIFDVQCREDRPLKPVYVMRLGEPIDHMPDRDRPYRFALYIEMDNI